MMTRTWKYLLGCTAVLASFQAAAQVRLYEHDNFRGRSFTTDRGLGDFTRAGFNDRASSAIVSGGRWVLCDNSRFGGNCVRLRPGRYPSLSAMGLNDRVSSARPDDGGFRGRGDDRADWQRDSNGHWRDADGRWHDGNNRWHDGDGRWRDGDGRWRDRDGRWRDRDGRYVDGRDRRREERRDDRRDDRNRSQSSIDRQIERQLEIERETRNP